MPRDEYCFKSSYSRLDDIPGITGRNSKLRYSLILKNDSFSAKGLVLMNTATRLQNWRSARNFSAARSACAQTA